MITFGESPQMRATSFRTGSSSLFLIPTRIMLWLTLAPKRLQPFAVFTMPALPLFTLQTACRSVYWSTCLSFYRWFQSAAAHGLCSVTTFGTKHVYVSGHKTHQSDPNTSIQSLLLCILQNIEWIYTLLNVFKRCKSSITKFNQLIRVIFPRNR